MWGDVKGHKYYYQANNEVQRKDAKKKAIAQAIAAAYSMSEKCSKPNAPDYCTYERRIKHPGSTLIKKEKKAKK